MAKKWKNIEQLLFGTSKSVIQTSFEFPRQQKEEEAEVAANPEVMEFKASQKLLNSNQSTAEVNDEKDNEEPSSNNKYDKNSINGNVISSSDILTSEKPDEEVNPDESDENVADSDLEEIDGSTMDEMTEIYEELLPISMNNKLINEQQAIIIETLVTVYDEHIAKMKENHKATMKKLSIENPAIRETIKNLKIDLIQFESDYFNERKRHEKQIATLHAELQKINRQEKELDAKVDAEILRLADGIFCTIYNEINLSEFSVDDEPHEEKENKEKQNLQAKINELDVTIFDLLSMKNVNFHF